MIRFVGRGQMFSDHVEVNCLHVEFQSVDADDGWKLIYPEEAILAARLIGQHGERADIAVIEEPGWICEDTRYVASVAFRVLAEEQVKLLDLAEEAYVRKVLGPTA